MKNELPILSFATPEAFEAWLESCHGQPDGIWLRFYKKQSGVPTVSYDQAVEVALCFGWIDGQKKAYDADSYLLKFTPRRARSVWSQVNVKRTEALIAAGRMREPGAAQIEAAKSDGRWERAYAPQSAATVPEDLQEALAANPRAAQFFAALTGANRYAILYRIGSVKRPETRERKIREFVAMLEEGRTAY